MHQPSMDSWNRNGTIFPKSSLLVCIFILIATQKFAASWASETGCSLNIQLSPSLNDSSCQEGDWDGFLHECCGEAFVAYIYALGQRANQTGQIFINSTEQRDCLSEMKSFKDDVFGCGIGKLSSGAGGCSDFSVADVMNRLGEDVRSLDVNCPFETSDKDMEKVCSSCLGTWRSIGGKDSTNPNIKFEKTEADVCRIAVLVSLISSKGKNEAFLHRVQRCLGADNLNTDKEISIGNQKKKSMSGIWILIGTIIGVILLIAIAAPVVLCRRKYFKSTPRKKEAAFEQLLSKETFCPRFPLKEVHTATNDLSEINVIGEGTTGKVYKGTMSNNQDVAIKHIINDGNMETFVREVTSLSHVRHPNLVSLLGCCVEGDECFLVYELCPNGSLSEWLFGKNKVLSWIQRLEIAIDSARGLCFLHTCPEGCIVHRDIKPTNILLGPKFEAKLSDFGLSKVIEVGETYVSSEVRGTFGYVDPEYQSNRHVNSSGDVYSFGIVLLQILSGKKAINLKSRKPMSLSKWQKLSLGTEA